MKNSRTILIFIFTFTLFFKGYGSTESRFQERYDSLNFKSLDEKALPIIKELLIEAKALKKEFNEIKLTLWCAKIYFAKNEFDTSYELFMESEELSIKYGFVKQQISAIKGMSHNLLLMNKSKECLKKIEEAIKIAEDNNLEHAIGKIIIIKAYYHQRRLEYELAINILKKQKEIFLKFDDKKGLQNNAFNTGVILLNMGKPEESLIHIEKFRDYAIEINDTIRLATCYLNLGKAHRKLYNFDDAISYFNKATEIGLKLSLERLLIDIYNNKYLFYYERGMYIKALNLLKNKDSLEQKLLTYEMDSKIIDLENENQKKLNENNILEAKIAQNKLRLRKQKLVTIMSFLLFLLAITTILLVYRKLNIKKKKRLAVLNKKIIDQKLIQKERENSLLANKIKSKEADITNLALDIRRRNDFKHDLNEKFEKLMKVDTTLIKKEIQSLLHSSKHQLQNNEDFGLIQNNVEIVNTEFFEKLDSYIKGLTRNDKYMAGLIKLNLSNKEIANIRGISINSARMNRYRLKKKLNLSAEIDLVHFLKEI